MLPLIREAPADQARGCAAAAAEGREQRARANGGPQPYSEGRRGGGGGICASGRGPAAAPAASTPLAPSGSDRPDPGRPDRRHPVTRPRKLWIAFGVSEYPRGSKLGHTRLALIPKGKRHGLRFGVSGYPRGSQRGHNSDQSPDLLRPEAPGALTRWARLGPAAPLRATTTDENLRSGARARPAERTGAGWRAAVAPVRTQTVAAAPPPAAALNTPPRSERPSLSGPGAAVLRDPRSAAAGRVPKQVVG